MQTNVDPKSLIYYDIGKAARYWSELKSKTINASAQPDKWKMLIPFFEELSAKNAVLVLLWDIKAARFIYATDKRKVVGYDMSLYTAPDGITFSAGNFHPGYYDSAMLLTHTCVEYLLTHKAAEQYKLIFNIDSLYKRNDDSYFHFLQQSVCIESNSDNQPLLFLNYIQDITHLKKEGTSNIVVTGPVTTKLWNYNFDKSCLESLHSFSKQEKTILRCLAQGKSSKTIAAELFISPNTVDTHRRNLLERTNCINSTGLVTYAKLVGLL